MIIITKDANGIISINGHLFIRENLREIRPNGINGVEIEMQSGTIFSGNYTNFTVEGVIPANTAALKAALSTVFLKPSTGGGGGGGIGTLPLGIISVKQAPYNAIGNGVTDDTTAIQTCINYAIANKIACVYFPKGAYKITSGIEIVKRNPDNTYENVMLTLMGDYNSYDINNGGGTEIYQYHKTDFIFGIQKAKGVSIYNISGYGQNTIRDITPVQISLPGTVWTRNGTRYSKRAPDCFVAVDPYGSSAIANANRYPGREAYYTHENNSGSTDIKISNCHVSDFNCGIAISSNGTTQNAEGILIERMFFSGVRDCVATGNSQTRTVILRDSFAWTGIHSVINGTYGQGISAPCWVQGFLNLAGGVKFLIELSSWRQDIYLDNVYGELIYAIGGNFNTAVNCNIFLTNCFIDFLGTYNEGGVYAKLPLSIANVGTMSIIGGRIEHYAVPNNGIAIRTLGNIPVLMQGVQITEKLNTPAKYIGCNLPNSVGVLYDKSEVALLKWGSSNSFIPFVIPDQIFTLEGTNTKRKAQYTEGESSGQNVVVTINAAANTWQFDVSTAYPSQAHRIRVGDKTQVYGALFDDMGVDFANLGFIANGGKIISKTAIAGGFTIVVEGVLNGMVSGNNYTIYTERTPVIKTSFIGSITGGYGSNDITGVVVEGDGVNRQIAVGDMIYSKLFGEAGIRHITAIAGTTFTVNGDPFADAATNAVFTTAKYKQTLEAGSTTDMPAFIAFKRGDEILNNFTVPANNDIEKWVCTQDGMTGGAALPVFKKVLLTV